MADRREFIKKILGTGVLLASVPALANTKLQTGSGVLFVDVTAIDIEDLAKALTDTVFAGWCLVAVTPSPGMSVHDSFATSHDLEDVHTLEGDLEWEGERVANLSILPSRQRQELLEKSEKKEN